MTLRDLGKRSSVSLSLYLAYRGCDRSGRGITCGVFCGVCRYRGRRGFSGDSLAGSAESSHREGRWTAGTEPEVILKRDCGRMDGLGDL
jgi:hypothetical protein